MADERHINDGLSPFSPESYDFTRLPDYDNDFIEEKDIEAFARALSVPESPSTDDLTSPQHSTQFITALNDWKPVYRRVRDHRRKKRRKPPRRGTDETREGFVYTLSKWPLLFVVLGWIVFLGAAYGLTRWYIYAYEHFITMRGKRERLKRDLHQSKTYEEWVQAAKEMDAYLGNERWKELDDYAYYNSSTVRNVRDELKRLRHEVEDDRSQPKEKNCTSSSTEELRTLVEAAVKNNFVGSESPRLYSETYYGTKNLIQSFIDELALCIKTLSTTSHLAPSDRANMFRHLSNNYGRTALCLSGGATFAYYHFGVAKALLDADVLPEVITGTSGGALVAALLSTRTDAELKGLLVPALANRITACHDDFLTWFRRWRRTGARFDSLDWARRCAWFTRGSLTFREAYARTGRILNVTCIPSDPHSPTVLANYLTAPDCVIWSATLASAAVPGILNPVVLLRKTRAGDLVPYSFGHKWKDGSLRTDIPLKALNTHFRVNFSIVSQANPHIAAFNFDSRGTPGRPVTHRRGRGWRGGFAGSALEQFLKLDLTKWLKVLRHLELLPRPLGQDWSEIWLQRFSGTITIWPKSVKSDFLYILSDPTPSRMARMIHTGQLCTFPKLKFIGNRFKVERLIDEGVRSTSEVVDAAPTNPKQNGAVHVPNVLSEEDLEGLLHEARRSHRPMITTSAETPRRDTARARKPHSLKEPPSAPASTGTEDKSTSPSISKRFSGWFSSKAFTSPRNSIDLTTSPQQERQQNGGRSDHRRGSSVMDELRRQSEVFFDDETDLSPDVDEEENDGVGEEEEGETDEDMRSVVGSVTGDEGH